MATTFVIACPECRKQVRVSDEHVGKRVKCKECGTVYPVKKPGAAAPPAPPAKAGAAKTKAAPPAPPKPKAAPPPPPEPAKAADGGEEDDPNKYVLAAVNDTLPRCPFCAKEMESEDARICLNCGYDTRSRRRPEVKAVYEVTGGERFLWLLPGILCIVAMLGLIVWYLIFYSNIEDWMIDSALEDEPGPPRTYYVGLGPPFMRLYHGLLLIFIFVPLTKFAYKRLVVNNKPQERTIKQE